MKTLLTIAALALIAFDASAESYVAELSCTSGPYRVRLPKSYKAVRGLGIIKRDRILKTEDLGTHTATHRELRFNGLELELVTSSDRPNQYRLSSAVVSTPNWKIGGPLRVGSPAKAALRGLTKEELPKEGELEFKGDTDSIRVTLAAHRVLDVEYSCHTE